MTDWVVDALSELDGAGSLLAVCKKIWQRHGEDISTAGDLFYRWQYEVRWAADIPRDQRADDGDPRRALDTTLATI